MCLALAFPAGSVVKNPPANAGDAGNAGSIPGSGRFLGQEDSLKVVMATYSSILAWKNPMNRGAWQATVHGLQRVGHD